MPRERGRLAAVLDQLPAVVAVFRGPDLILDYANPALRALAGDALAIDRPVRDAGRDVLTGPDLQRLAAVLEGVHAAGEVRDAEEVSVRLADPGGDRRRRHFDAALVPLRDEDGRVEAVLLHAVEVTGRVESRARAAEAEQRFAALVEANVIGVTITGENDLLEANDAFLELIGYTREDLAAGVRWTDLTPDEWSEADARALRGLREEGIASPYEKEYVRKDGARVPVLLSGTRVREDPLVVLATVYDLTERKAVEREISSLLERERDARFAAELASARVGRLQEITAGLSASISPDEIARVVVNHAIEDLSASAGVLAILEGGDVTLGHAVGYDRAVIDEWRRFPVALPAPLSDAMRRLEPVIIGDREVYEAAYPAVATASRFAALVAVPLIAAGGVLGAIGLSFREARTLTPEDQEFLRALAQQAAAALERAQLFENRAYVAQKLQEGLLPARLDPVPGLQAGVRYTSISGGGEVGGDFYDVFSAGERRWTAAVGDVCGKGTEAAVITGLARHTVRAIAALRESPVDVLAFLNKAIRRHAAVPAFCTVGCAVIRPAPDGFSVCLASGGHPYPLLLRADGRVEEVVVTGTMLGVAADPDLEEVSVRLSEGDALVMFTDGVVDARRQGGERFGEQRLLAAVAGAAGLDADGIAGAIEAAVREHHPDVPADDRAIVVLRAGAD